MEKRGAEGRKFLETMQWRNLRIAYALGVDRSHDAVDARAQGPSHFCVTQV